MAVTIYDARGINRKVVAEIESLDTLENLTKVYNIVYTWDCDIMDSEYFATEKDFAEGFVNAKLNGHKYEFAQIDFSTTYDFYAEDEDGEEYDVAFKLLQVFMKDYRYLED